MNHISHRHILLSLALVLLLTQVILANPFFKQRNGGTKSNKDVIAAMASGRTACGLYVWDAPSALLSRWCNHLQKDSVYEGRGGKKFVRIEPNSILQLLYPCSRYSADKCILCGGKYRDHLALRWSKHLYTPFDLLVDKVYREGVIVADEASSKVGKRKIQPPATRNPIRDFAFHRRYVLDVSHELDALKDKHKRKKILRRLTSEWSPKLQGKPLEMRTVFRSNGSKIVYTVPAFTLKENQSASKASLLVVIREVVLSALDNVIELEEKDKMREDR